VIFFFSFQDLLVWLQRFEHRIATTIPLGQAAAPCQDHYPPCGIGAELVLLRKRKKKKKVGSRLCLPHLPQFPNQVCSAHNMGKKPLNLALQP